jgi:uncharacterized integral membrane protein (TIGR00698 family)
MKRNHFLFTAGLLCCLFPFVSAPVALLAGIVIVSIAGHPFEQHSARITRLLLQISVAGLGFGVPVTAALQAGGAGWWLAAGSVMVTLAAGWFAGRLFHLPKRTTALVSVGTAICGGSAIAATAPVIKAREEEIAVALITVFILNAMALVVFPWIGQLLSLTQEQFGFWAAIAIHDTSSVAGAAQKYGVVALQIATTVKLIRALWIIPLTAGIGWIKHRTLRSLRVPWFMLVFAVAVLLNAWLPLPDFFTKDIVAVCHRLLVVTLFWVGASLTPKLLRRAGWRPLLMGTSIWVFIAAISLWVICKTM